MKKEYDDQGLLWIDGKRTVLTVSEYANIKGISRQAVLSKIKRGIIKATRLGVIWIIQEGPTS